MAGRHRVHFQPEEKRELFERTEKFTYKGNPHAPDGHRCVGPPAEETDCRPGTLDKLLVLAERAERQEELHHPDDWQLHPTLTLDAHENIMQLVRHRHPEMVAAAAAKSQTE